MTNTDDVQKHQEGFGVGTGFTLKASRKAAGPERTAATADAAVEPRLIVF